MVANYHRDSLRHWSCTCSADEAFRLRQKIASSGIELPEVDICWTITDGEQNPQSVRLAAWEHVVDVLGAAIRGDFNTTAEAIDATKMDFADVLKCFDVRATAEWEPMIIPIAVPALTGEERVTSKEKIKAELESRGMLFDEARASASVVSVDGFIGALPISPSDLFAETVAATEPALAPSVASNDPLPTTEPPQPEVSSDPVSPTAEPAVESESVPVSEVKEGENLDS